MLDARLHLERRIMCILRVHLRTVLLKHLGHWSSHLGGEGIKMECLTINRKKQVRFGIY